MRLIVARCAVEYSGRLSARLPEALRLIMVKADGSVLVHADAGGYKPLNWMTPPTVIEEAPGALTVRKLKGEDRLDILLTDVLSDSEHAMEADADRLEKDGVEADLQVALAAMPERCGEGFRLVRREWPTDIGPVDLMCRDGDEGGWRSRSSASGRSTPSSSSAATSSASGWTRRWRAAAACSRRRWSSRRRGCSRRRAGSGAWRSTSRSCAGSASPS